MKKKITKIIFIFFFLSILLYLYQQNLNKEKQETKIKTSLPNDNLGYNSNVLKDVNYTSKDASGNEYIIKALIGEIDFSNNNIIYLTDVSALIKLNDSKNITINSDFGKYNTDNNDTIFSKNVIVNYLDNKINSEYLDFSIQRNSMIVSRNVVYTNLENVLNADVIEVNINTKDTKIYMYENNKKVNVKSKN
tara:strand:+ start:114 stop:689 length:576 start_codon:yes stop_codon:yes gene_type:complete